MLLLTCYNLRSIFSPVSGIHGHNETYHNRSLPGPNNTDGILKAMYSFKGQGRRQQFKKLTV